SCLGVETIDVLVHSALLLASTGSRALSRDAADLTTTEVGQSTRLSGPLDGRVAVVDEDRVPRHSRRRVAREEDGGADDLARQAQLLPERPRLQEVAGHGRLLRARPRERRVAEARTDAVHAPSAVDPFEREDTRQLEDPAFARDVRARVRVGDERADRGDVD